VAVALGARVALSAAAADVLRRVIAMNPRQAAAAIYAAGGLASGVIWGVAARLVIRPIANGATLSMGLDSAMNATGMAARSAAATGPTSYAMTTGILKRAVTVRCITI
jgi:hypothetical protein